MRDEGKELLTFVIILMDGGLQILGKMCDELERKREKNREERGKGKNRESSGGRRVYVG